VDNSQLTAHREALEGGYSKPIATRTKLGWAIDGISHKPGQTLAHHSFHICETTLYENELHHIVKDFFSGVNVANGKPKSRESKH
jgi:hypothetical protein